MSPEENDTMTNADLVREARKPPKAMIAGLIATILSLIGVGVQMGRFIQTQERTDETTQALVKSVDSLEQRMRAVEVSVAILLDREENGDK